MATQKPTILNRNLLVALGIPTVFIPGLILAAILGWNWENDLSRLAAKGGYYVSEKVFPKNADVVTVIDGDTIQISNDAIVRLIGIDAPDIGQEGYEAAKEYLNLLAQDPEVALEYDKYQDDKYGRVLAYVWQKCTTEIGCQDGRRMLNWVMVKEGYAKIVLYKDRGKLRYQDLLLSAQQN